MITYKKAGVDIDAGNELVQRIKKMAPRIGGFSDGMALPKGYKEPILIGCTDGVGTKLAIAQALKIHDTIGYDLVGMNVNDLICSGAKPIFFLDNFAYRQSFKKRNSHGLQLFRAKSKRGEKYYRANFYSAKR